MELDKKRIVFCFQIPDFISELFDDDILVSLNVGNGNLIFLLQIKQLHLNSLFLLQIVSLHIFCTLELLLHFACVIFPHLGDFLMILGLKLIESLLKCQAFLKRALLKIHVALFLHGYLTVEHVLQLIDAAILA